MDKNIICEWDIISVSTYLKCFIKSLLFKCKYENIIFRNIDVTDIVNNQVRKDLYNQNIFRNLLIYYYVLSLCEHDNISLIISWFENQQNNRAFNMAVNESCNNTENIGYQGFIVSESFYYYHYPTKYEKKIKAIPKKIAVIGSNMVNRVSKYSKTSTIEAPSFRYNKLFDRDLNYQGGNNIIVSLPIDTDSSMKMLEFLSNTILMDYINKVLVNYHPASNIKKIKKLYNSKYIFTSSQFSELVPETSLVISNSTSVCIESLACAVPVIVINNISNVDMNPIPSDVDRFIWSECFTVDEFKKCFHSKYFTYDKNRFESIAKYVRQKYFINTTNESINNILID